MILFLTAEMPALRLLELRKPLKDKSYSNFLFIPEYNVYLSFSVS